MLETLTSREFWVGSLACVAAMAAVLTVLGPMFKQDPMKVRLKRVSDHKEKLRAAHKETLKQRGAGLRNENAKGVGRDVVQQLKLLELFDAKSAGKKLAQAGMRGEKPVFTFMLARLGMPFVVGIGTLFYMYVLKVGDFGSFMRLAISIGGFGIGFYLPNVWVTNKITKRQQKIQLAFPDSLDLLLICVESGMSIEAALQKVSEEVGANCPELSEELGLTTAELSYLQDRKDAYSNLGERTGIDGVKAVVTALIQSEVYGTPVGAALRVMAAENRELRMQAAEKKAAALPPKLTVPMILFNLPVLFCVILGPAMLRVFGIAE